MSVLSGSVTFNFDDARKKSKTFKLKEKIVLKKSNYGILIIPPNIWFNFKGNTNNSIIVNALNFPHNKLETKKRNL